MTEIQLLQMIIYNSYSKTLLYLDKQHFYCAWINIIVLHLDSTGNGTRNLSEDKR